MSTVEYPCDHCGIEIGSAQDITWQGSKPFHPDCVEFEAIRATALAIAAAFAVLEEKP